MAGSVYTIASIDTKFQLLLSIIFGWVVGVLALTQKFDMTLHTYQSIRVITKRTMHNAIHSNSKGWLNKILHLLAVDDVKHPTDIFSAPPFNSKHNATTKVTITQNPKIINIISFISKIRFPTSNKESC